MQSNGNQAVISRHSSNIYIIACKLTRQQQNHSGALHLRQTLPEKGNGFSFAVLLKVIEEFLRLNADPPNERHHHRSDKHKSRLKGQTVQHDIRPGREAQNSREGGRKKLAANAEGEINVVDTFFTRCYKLNPLPL